MDPVNNNSVTASFPLDEIRRAGNRVSQAPVTSASYSSQSYDNRSRISETAQTLRANLGGFRTRITSNSFLTETFSWQARTADTSLPAKISPGAPASAEPDTYSLDISRPASGSSAQTQTLDSDDAADIETGTYSFTLAKGSDTWSIDLELENEADDPLTNKELLKEIAQAIEGRNTGLKVTVREYQTMDYEYEGEYKSVSLLEISSSDTGEDATFSLADTSGSLIASMGLDRLRSFGRDAAYSVDGQAGTNSSNTITLGTDGTFGVITGATDSGENLTVRVRQGTQALAEDLEFLITEYNSLIQWINDNDSVINPTIKDTLFQGLDAAGLEDRTLSWNGNGDGNATGQSGALRVDRQQVSTPSTLVTAGGAGIEADLEKIGLTLNNDGTLEINAGFDAAVQGSLQDVYDTLGGESGLFTKIGQAIDTIQESPEGQYVRSRAAVLSYSPDGSDNRPRFQASGSRLVNLFA